VIEDVVGGAGRTAFAADAAPEFRQPLAGAVGLAVGEAAASTTAFMAPALVPEIASKDSLPSSIRASSTPQVKAPCAPPPCSARDRGFLLFLG
jgi:hypothetical protein